MPIGAKYLSYVKSIETHARAFLPLNISAVGSVKRVLPHKFIPAKSFNIPAPLYHTGTGKTANRVSRLSFMIDLLTALH